MKSIKAKLKKPANSVPSNKDDWSKFDQRIWHSVAVNQPVKLAAKLSKHDSINVNKLSPDVGYSVVHYAAAKGLDDCLNVLLAHKANVSTRDVTGATPLHASARYGHRGTTTKLLASRTVDVNARDNNSCTALHFAAFEGHLGCLCLIAEEKGADIHCVDKEGRTLLMAAAAMGRLPVCTELIRRGVNVNHRDSSDKQHTALILAAEAGHADVVRLLCENGADYEAKLSDGRNALDVARGRSRKSVIDALHIMQLTEAAKKTDKGARLSTSGKPTDKIEERNSNRKSMGDVFVPSGSEDTATERSVAPKQHDTHTKNQVYANKLDPNSSGVLSLYNDSKQFSTMYERDVHMYDSKSTLASLSSIDVTNDSSQNRSYVTAESSMASPLSTVQQPSSDLKRQVTRLSGELKERDDLVASLQLELKGLKAVAVEAETLKLANRKAEALVKELQNDNRSLASNRQQLLEQNELLATRGRKLQNQLDKCDQEETKAKQKLEELKNEIVQMNGRVSDLTQQNEELAAINSSQAQKQIALDVKTEELLRAVDAPTAECGDSDANFDALKTLLLQLHEDRQARQRKSASDEEHKRNELETLQRRLREKEDEVENLTTRFAKSQTSLGKYHEENSKLVVTLRNEAERLDEFETLNKKHFHTIENLMKENARLKEELSGNTGSQNHIGELQVKISILEKTCQRLLDEVANEKRKRDEQEELMKEEVESVYGKYNESKKSAAELEKAMSELRSERNHREAKVAQLEKELQRSESKRNESDVECNRARQKLTEAKRECTRLLDEVSLLRKSKKELSAQVTSLKLYEFNEAERKRIDSMQEQLDHLCKHIQTSENDYNQTIAIYRNHLLKAAEGELNDEVLSELKGILKLLDRPHSSNSS